jgi:hypothetical protein
VSAYYTVAAWMVVPVCGPDTEITAVIGDRVYEGAAPTGATYPLITVQPYTDPDDTNYSGRRAFTTVDLLVRVWDKSAGSRGASVARIVPAADRADEVVTVRVPVSMPRGVIRSCVRTNETNSMADGDGVTSRAVVPPEPRSTDGPAGMS